MNFNNSKKEKNCGRFSSILDHHLGYGLLCLWLLLLFRWYAMVCSFDYHSTTIFLAQHVFVCLLSSLVWCFWFLSNMDLMIFSDQIECDVCVISHRNYFPLCNSYAMLFRNVVTWYMLWFVATSCCFFFASFLSFEWDVKKKHTQNYEMK